MTNSEALENAIKAAGIKKDYICERLGITYATFRRKCNNERPFTVPEMVIVADVLGLSSKETRRIFYAQMRD